MSDTYDDDLITPHYDPDSECYDTPADPEPEPERDWHQEAKDDALRPLQEEPSEADWYADDEDDEPGDGA
ncbi:MAG TPA: hypothetical protein VGG83_10605 [Trebonia sp.]|jgi:hypothetical protein